MEEQKNNFKIKVELVRCESLRPSVRAEKGLPAKGVVIKKITKNSPLTVSYEKIEGGLANFITSKIDRCNMVPIVNACRKKFG